jgi:hypothetical protein
MRGGMGPFPQNSTRFAANQHCQTLAHDPPKCKRFGEKIMRSINSLERDRTQNRIPLLLVALVSASWAKTVDGWLPRGKHFEPSF